MKNVIILLLTLFALCLTGCDLGISFHSDEKTPSTPPLVEHDKRLSLTTWQNISASYLSDQWYFNESSCSNKYYEGLMLDTLNGPWSMSLSWQTISDSILIIGISYFYKTPGYAITNQSCSRRYQYKFANDTGLVINGFTYRRVLSQ